MITQDFETLEKLANLLREGDFNFDEMDCSHYDDELRISIIIYKKEIKK